MDFKLPTATTTKLERPRTSRRWCTARTANTSRNLHHSHNNKTSNEEVTAVVAHFSKSVGYGFKSSEWLCKNWHTNLLLTRRDNPHAYGVFPTISQHFKITCSVLARFFFPPFPSSSWILSKLYGFPTYFPNTLSFPILTRAWAHFPVPACSVYSANYIINTCLQSHLSALLRIVLCMSCIG